MPTNNKLHFETLQVRVGQEQPDPATDSRAVPIYATTAYVFKNSQHASDRFHLKDLGNVYSRITNSTQGVFESRIAALESGVAGLAVSSGAAAITYAIQNIAQAGQNVVSSLAIYGGTYNLFAHTLPRYGITTKFVHPRNFEEYEKAIDENTRAIYVETLANPDSDIEDIDKVAEIAHRHNIPLIVDNTFATPYLFRPIEHGADFVVESATKFIGGHGNGIGGVIVESGKFDFNKAPEKYPQFTEPDPSYHGIKFADLGAGAFVTRIRTILLRDTGSTLSPFNAFLFLQGVETLSLRVERHVENALKVVEFLNNHPKIEAVHHPSLEGNPANHLYRKYFPNGAGSIFSFEVKGGQDEAFKFIDNLQLFSILANVADVKSLVIHPYTTTHSQETPDELERQGIYQNTVRFSIGIENIEDLLADIAQALDKI
ncbi:MAG: O-acetylhomoserine aminocarboxypropyltransferase/cysteine synthase [Paludibacteraceae bacterium]|nr:O-acetylhomoserine aminocarboxypropyltransferase/cysteine synthase [Paludibacteraceae bacterium]